jgi:hypothetical protein
MKVTKRQLRRFIREERQLDWRVHQMVDSLIAHLENPSVVDMDSDEITDWLVKRFNLPHNPPPYGLIDLVLQNPKIDDYWHPLEGLYSSPEGSQPEDISEVDELDEGEGSTIKYNANPALKGDQTKLPDALQKGIIDKEESEKDEPKNERKMRITKRQLQKLIKEYRKDYLSKTHPGGKGEERNPRLDFNEADDELEEDGSIQGHYAEFGLDQADDMLEMDDDLKDDIAETYNWSSCSRDDVPGTLSAADEKELEEEEKLEENCGAVEQGEILGHGGTAKMAKSQLFQIAQDSAALHDMLSEEDELPEWVQSKIAVMAASMDAVFDHLEYKLLKHAAEDVEVFSTEDLAAGLGLDFTGDVGQLSGDEAFTVGYAAGKEDL